MKGNEPLFDLGELACTPAIMEAMQTNEKFHQEVVKAMKQYRVGEWGDVVPNDAEMNDRAVERGNDRILACYHTSIRKIYIITEHDRSSTMIMFCNEY